MKKVAKYFDIVLQLFFMLFFLLRFTTFVLHQGNRADYLSEQLLKSLHSLNRLALLHFLPLLLELVLKHFCLLLILLYQRLDLVFVELLQLHQTVLLLFRFHEFFLKLFYLTIKSFTWLMRRLFSYIVNLVSCSSCLTLCNCELVL